MDMLARTGRIVLASVLAFAAVSCGGEDGSAGTEAVPTVTQTGSMGPQTGGSAWERIDATALEERMATEDVYLVNVHVPYEGEIPGTDAFISYTEIADRLGELPDDGSLVIYCRSGNMSTQSAQEMVDAGFTAFAELEGGYQAWEAAGFPFEVEAG